MSKILVLCGSTRKASLNRKLMYVCAEYLVTRCTVDVLEASQVNLPLYNQEIEQQPDIYDRVAALYDRFEAADGFVVVSPEYNASVTAFLKNTIDWVSRLQFIRPNIPNPFLHRPVLFGSAVSSWTGGSFGIAHARSIFTYLGAMPMSEHISLGQAERFWDGEKPQFPPPFIAFYQGALSHLLELADRPRFGSRRL